jgi:hypothetical protein
VRHASHRRDGARADRRDGHHHALVPTSSMLASPRRVRRGRHRADRQERCLAVK